MRIFAHQIRWSFRRHRLMLLAWIALLTANAFLDAVWPTVALERTARDVTGTIRGLLAAGEVLFSMVLAAEVIQADSAVGTTAFWMTRPIPPHVLVAVKLTLLAVAFLCAPVFADLIVMLAYQVPIVDAVAVSAQTALFWAIWVSLLAALAVVTPNLAKFSLAIGAVIATAVTALAVMATVMLRRISSAPVEAQSVVVGSSEISWGLVAVVAVVMVFVQHRTRRRLSTGVVAILGLVVVYGIDLTSAGKINERRFDSPAWATAPAALELIVDPATTKSEALQSFAAEESRWHMVRARMRVRGIAPDWTARIQLAAADVRSDAHPPLVSLSGGYGADVPIEDFGDLPQTLEVTRRLLDVKTLVSPSLQERGEAAVILIAPTIELMRASSSPASYSGRFHVYLTHHTLEAVLPLTEGSEHRADPYRFAIARVSAMPGGIGVLARQSNATSMFGNRIDGHRRFYLRNTTRSEAVETSPQELRSDVSLMRVLPFALGAGAADNAGFRAHVDSLHFSKPYGESRSIQLDQDWAAQAELVIVRETDGGMVERRVTIPNLSIIMSR